jgi:hypothetical protein
MRVGPSGPSPSSLRDHSPGLATKALRSAPAQKWPLAPQSTATCCAGSASKARKASASACAVAPVDGVARRGAVDDDRGHRARWMNGH